LSVIIGQYIVWFIETVLKQSTKHNRALYILTSWRVTVCCTAYIHSQGRRQFGSSDAAVPDRRVQGTTKWV